ncbi:MAG TPA: hypothetical protein VM425_10110 [Myxococcota bacterium]|nr:hypothetical protein [Myxococcota bacterium]
MMGVRFCFLVFCLGAVLGAGCSSDVAGPNRAPLANAGPDRVQKVGQSVDLDGSGSFDPDGDRLNFQWDIISAPAGAMAEIANPQARMASIIPDKAGVWVIRLAVSDTRLPSEPDVMQLRATPSGCTQDRDCNDNVDCTTDTCDTDAHECLNTPNDALCPDDGNFCNGTEYCDSSSGCGHTGDPCASESKLCDAAGGRCVDCLTDGDCDDGVDCTTDSCDGGAGTCGSLPDDALCPDDGVFCNGPESCDAANGCVSGGDPCFSQGLVCDEATGLCRTCVQAGDCDDGVACTTDTCDTGTCLFTPDDTACPDDGVFCNGPEICDRQAGCVGDGDPCTGLGQLCDAGNGLCVDCLADSDCFDGVACTDDVCDNGLGTCSSSADDANCDDGAWCNGSEICDALAGCRAGTAPNCVDGVACTDDSCNEGSDSCDNLPNDSACNDGNMCTLNTCDALAGCQTANNDGAVCAIGACSSTCLNGLCDGCTCNAASDCNDGVSCTVDDCSGGMCTNVPSNSLCNDGAWCNGAEICDALAGCQAGTAPNCGDGVDCTDDSCNEGTDSCDNLANNANCDDGAWCNGPERCDALLGCQPGVAPNCNDGVSCTDDSCNEGTDSCDNPANNANCDDGAWCNGAESCNALAGCQAGTAPNCNDGVACTDDGCNEDTDSCNNLANNSLCNDGNVCTLNTCDALAGCQAANNDGAACTVNGCTSTCLNGLCDGCTCGNASDCNDGVACTVDDCVGGMCINTPTDSLCDDGAWCNGAENCNALTGCQAGTAPNCDDGVACTGDSCNEGSDSCDNTANNAICDDGAWCNGAESCDTLLGCQAGAAPNCDDGVACTDDSCNEGSDSCDNLANNANCDDGAWCNGAESCNALLGCQAGVAPNCDDGVACTDDSCNEGTDSCDNLANNANCDDGSWCNGAESCDALADCQAGVAPNCDDGVACTDDSCNEGTDSCDNVANNANCDDGTWCNGAESCDVLADCQAGVAPNCNDGVACTDDSCDEGADSCDNFANNANCDDGTWCNGSESCDALLGCQAGVLPNCNDGVACTDDSCNEGNNSCDNLPNDSNCDDGAWCNGAENCDALADCQAGVAPNCNDGVACTDDSCNEGSDSCNNLVNDANCDDGTWCNGAESCDLLADCQAGVAPNCNDGVVCTDDSCNEGTDSCDNLPNNANCDDGAWCNGAESCDALLDCQAGLPPNCNDGVACTDDSCNEGSDSCDNLPNDANCDDGTWCNGAEICNALAGCQAGTGLNCDDGVACTDDSCNEGTHGCDNLENNANCTSPDLCVTACSPDASGCVTPPGSFTLTCEDPVYLDLDTVSDCSITLAGGGDITGQEACLSCSASVGVTTLIQTDFEDDLNPGNCAPVVDQIADGWTIVTGTECYGTGTTCPMSDTNNRDCCDNLMCPIDNDALLGTIAFQADRDSCNNGDRQWRLQHTFDTTGLTNLELCFDYADRQAAGNNDVLQVDVADPNGNYQAAVFCDADGPRAGLDNTWFRTCVDISTAAPFVDDKPAVSVIFFAHSNDNNNRIYIDNITLRGESISCPASVVAITEDFSTCTDPLTDWNGWTVGGGASINCSPSFSCFDASNRAWVDDTGGGVGEFYQYFDLSAVTDLQLCFYYGENGANANEIVTVDVDSGLGWQPVWSNEGNFGSDNTCEQVCLNLSDLDPAVDHNANAGIRIQLEADDHEIDLDQIVISGHPDCSLPAVVSLSNPQDPDMNGTYDFTATDSDAQITSDISCQWTPDPALSDWDRVWCRPAGINPTNVGPGLLCMNPNSLNIGSPSVIDTDAGTISGVAPGDIRFKVVPQGGGAPALGVFAFATIDITADVAVTGSNALVLLSCNDVNISGIINACASGQTGGAGGDDGGPGGSDGDGTGYGQAGNSNGFSDSGGGGAGFGGAGGDGGDAPGASGGTGGTTYGTAALSPLLGGSGGGGGNNGGGGGGGGAVQISAGGFVVINSPGGIDVCGAGGAVPTVDGASAGGGGSGGGILVEAINVLGDGTLAANGGGGGGGDGFGGGVTSTPGQPGPFGWARAAGGTSSGNGGDGGQGGGADTDSGDPGVGDGNAGGGGGAVGLVRVNTLSGSSTFSSTGTSSPDASSGAYSEGNVVVW